MATRNFGSLLDGLAGRGDAVDPAELDSERMRELAMCAQRLIDAGRRATSVTSMSARARKRALRIFREHHRPENAMGSILRLVLDSFQGMTPALRRAGGSSTRFLKFEGDIVVELQVAPDSRGVELRGQVTAPGQPEGVSIPVRLTVGNRERVGKVDPDGTFVFRNVARGAVTLHVLGARVEVDL